MWKYTREKSFLNPLNYIQNYVEFFLQSENLQNKT